MEQPSQEYAPVTTPSKSERTTAMLCHISALAGALIPFGNIIAPLVIWLIKKEESAFVNDQGKEAVNFQITATIVMVVCLLLIMAFIGMLLAPIAGLTILVLVIIATIRANEGVAYRYPFAIRFIK